MLTLTPDGSNSPRFDIPRTHPDTQSGSIRPSRHRFNPTIPSLTGFATSGWLGGIFRHFAVIHIRNSDEVRLAKLASDGSWATMIKLERP